MNELQFIAALVGSLAWPIAAVGISVFLRRPLIDLLDRAKSAEGFGAKLTFGERVEAVREVVEETVLLSPVPKKQLALPEPTPSQEQTTEVLQSLADELSSTSASGTVIAAWAQLEAGLKSIAEFNEVEWTSRNVLRNIEGLADYLSTKDRSSIEALRKLRNEVAHGVGKPPTLAEARSYRATVQEIIDNVGLRAGLHRWR